DPTLTLAPSVGTSETEEQEAQALVTRVRDGRNTTPRRSCRQRQPLTDPGKRDRLEEQHHSAIRGGSERALGKVDPRGGVGLGSRQKSGIRRSHVESIHCDHASPRKGRGHASILISYLGGRDPQEVQIPRGN
ncbi:hypothetical protein PIB30_107520, partial [Stylosanthes scabra]|nr:hypothetical protein [Stylosanthes scabra]